MNGLMITELLSCQIKAATQVRHLREDNERREETEEVGKKVAFISEHVGGLLPCSTSWHIIV